MTGLPPIPRLTDIVGAIELITEETTYVSLHQFQGDKRKR
jgi:hypothetical protein